MKLSDLTTKKGEEIICKRIRNLLSKGYLPKTAAKEAITTFCPEIKKYFGEVPVTDEVRDLANSFIEYSEEIFSKTSKKGFFINPPAYEDLFHKEE